MKFNLIFDLDETLINSIELDKHELTILDTDQKVNEIFFLKKYNRLVFCRSYMSFLLRYCFNNFNVGFWTAGKTDYGNEILKHILLPSEYKKCICIIGRVKRNKYNTIFKDIKNNKKFTINNLDDKTIKPLSELFNKKLYNFTKNNTLLIDNETYNIIPNPLNSIYIINSCIKKKDNILFELFLFLQENKNNKFKSLSKNINTFLLKMQSKKSCKKYNKILKRQKQYNIGDYIIYYNPELYDYNLYVCIISINKDKSYKVIDIYEEGNSFDIKAKFIKYKIII